MTHTKKSIHGTTTAGRIRKTLFVALFALAARPAQADVITAADVTVGVDDVFTIPIAIEDALGLTSWQIDLSFDPAIVAVNQVSEGAFLASFSSLGGTIFVPGIIDNGAGVISLIAGMYADLAPLPSGSGVLANIEFVALAPGVSPLLFSNVFLNGLDQGFAIAPGQITVGTPDGGGGSGGGNGGGGSQSVPEPTTLVLLTSGLLAAIVGARLTDRRRIDNAGPRGGRPGLAIVAAILGSLVLGGRATAQIISPPTVEPPTTILQPPLGYPPTTSASAPGPYFAKPAYDQTLAPNLRFVVLTNFSSDAVLDRETGLVWARRLLSTGGSSPTTAMSYYAAEDACHMLVVGNKGGWRVPAASELNTLLDFSRTVTESARLSPGHPFDVTPFPTSGSRAHDAWSSTECLGSLVIDTSGAIHPTDICRYSVDLRNGNVSRNDATDVQTVSAATWCVRGSR